MRKRTVSAAIKSPLYVCSVPYFDNVARPFTRFDTLKSDHECFYAKDSELSAFIKHGELHHSTSDTSFFFYTTAPTYHPEGSARGAVVWDVKEETVQIEVVAYTENHGVDVICFSEVDDTPFLVRKNGEPAVLPDPHNLFVSSPL